MWGEREGGIGTATYRPHVKCNTSISVLAGSWLNCHWVNKRILNLVNVCFPWWKCIDSIVWKANATLVFQVKKRLQIRQRMLHKSPQLELLWRGISEEKKGMTLRMKFDGPYISFGFIPARPSESKESHHPERSLGIKLQMSSRFHRAYIASWEAEPNVNRGFIRISTTQWRLAK